MILKLLILSFIVLVKSALAESQAWCQECPKYMLQTSLQNQPNQIDYGTLKDSMWLGYYHTFAGQGDAVLESDPSHAWVGWLNGTSWIMADPTNGPTSQVAGMGIAAWDYQNFDTVYLQNGANTHGGFYVDGSFLRWQSSKMTGWLVCDWWHGVPQLFADVVGFANWAENANIYPAVCSFVDLIMVPVPQFNESAKVQ